ncbi:DNA polymerase II [Alteromonas gilva]|uniref:DNA polymerase n=1 Tax=Alteromonas gilva TaxID=2987522 RepID=A0ABT5L5K0_9ALTE|nr:DNA polymerase II [Alteromonas gilva]MDC8832335.1 DNA polymerase II [Alteromonas gilva]
MTKTVAGHGMVLTARMIPRGSAQQIEIWLAGADGPKRLLTPPEPAICFVSQQETAALKRLCKEQGITASVTPLSLTTFTHEAVSVVKLQQDKLLYRLRRLCAEHAITLYEADIKTTERFFMERFITSGVTYRGQPGADGQTINNARLKPADFRTRLLTFSFDIECNEKGELFSIGIASPVLNNVLMIGDNSNSTPGALADEDAAQPFSITWCDNEKALLAAFMQLVQHHDPDILLGWNVKQFDLPVLADAAKRCGIKLSLGRQHAAVEIRVFDDNRAIVEVPGRAVIDGIEGLKSMTFQFDSFALDNVANHLLGKNKLIDEPDKLSAIKHLFHHDKRALAAYNYQDCVLVNDIADKVRLTDFLMLRSELTGLRLGRPGGSVASFINLYLPRLHRAGYISPNRPNDGGLASPGGYVMSSKPGLYRNVLVLDFKSLYPSIIRTFKIDPLGLVEGLKQPTHAIPGFKGALFSRDKHFLPDIITSLWQQRDEAKQQQDKPRSQAIKILMNSFYGVLGSGGCPFYDTRLASSITMRGHEIMQITADWITQAGYDVIYGDTDSTFVHIDQDIDADAIQRIGRQLEQDINQRWQHKTQKDYGVQCDLEIEFETHYERFFMPTIRGSEAGSKKRYAGLIRQGDSTEIVFKGLENVRSDWTTLAKDFQQALYEKIFSDTPVNDYVTQIITGIKSGQFDHQLIYTKQIRKPLREYTKTAPPHVKAARHADEQNRKYGKPLQYQKRTSIHYVMTTIGPQVPEYRSHPLDYDHYIDKQIRPIADSILPAIGKHFETLVNQQLGLF